MRVTTRGMAYLAFLTALGVVLTRFASIRIVVMGVEGIRVGFGGFPIIFAGLLFGPAAGGIVGALTDIIGYILSPVAGPYMPHFTFTAALTGILPALTVRLVRRRGEKPGFLLLTLAVLGGQLVTSLLLVPYFLHTLFGLPYQVILVPRFFTVAIEVPLYAGIAHLLLRRLEPFFEKLQLSYQWVR